MQHMGRDPDLGIFAGVEIHFLEPALEKIATLLGPTLQNCCTPSKLQLALAIEAHYHDILDEYDNLDNEERAVWAPMIDYLGGASRSLSRQNISKNNKKVRLLSLRLAEVFHDYGRVGKQLFRTIPEKDRWQQSLWEKLERTYEYWNYPFRKLSVPKNTEPPENVQIHLFTINQLTPLHHRYLSHIDKLIPTAHYVISPCQQFWSDIVSDKERAHMEKRLIREGIDDKQIVELDEYLTDTNPLLANLGKLGRSQARLLEGNESEVFERYAIPASIEEYPRYANILAEDLVQRPDTLLTVLKLLQTDLLVLKNPDSDEKISFDSDDSSVQLHAVPKSTREIDVAYNLLLEAMMEKGVKPEAIAVIVPDIREYLPDIHSVFGALDSQIPYHIISNENALKNPTIRGFLELLAIANSRWEATKILSLFSHKIVSTTPRT